MQIVREYRRIDLVGTQKRAEKIAADPSFRAFHEFHENIFAVERYQTKVKLDKSIYTGAAVFRVIQITNV